MSEGEGGWGIERGRRKEGKEGRMEGGREEEGREIRAEQKRQ